MAIAAAYVLVALTAPAVEAAASGFLVPRGNATVGFTFHPSLAAPHIDSRLHVQQVKKSYLVHPSQELPEKFAKLFQWEEQIRASPEYRTDFARKHLRKRAFASAVPTAGELFAALATKGPPPQYFGSRAKVAQQGPPQGHAHVDHIMVVIGILFLESQVHIQQAHYHTWMQQPGVCQVARHAEPGCRFFAVPLFGNASASERARLQASLPQTDVVFMEEANMVSRELDWFRYARDHFPWATHVMKMDSDTYPVLPLIGEDLSIAPRSSLYYGQLLEGSNRCNSGFMHGSLYVISADLCDCFVAQRESMQLTPEGEEKRKHWEAALGGEEVFGNILFDAQRTGRCPALLCMKARAEHDFRSGHGGSTALGSSNMPRVASWRFVHPL